MDTSIAVGDKANGRGGVKSEIDYELVEAQELYGNY